MGEHYRGRIMYRITRPDRQVYIARATLANGHYIVEAIFDTDDELPVHGAQTVDITERWITIQEGRALNSYPLASFKMLARGDTTMPIPPVEVLGLANHRGGPYGLSAGAEQDPSGLWILRVDTPRGAIFVPVIPGDRWEDVLKLAGLGDTVEP